MYPCIMMAYLGQGAHLIKYPEDAPTAFWSSVPDLWFWSVWIYGSVVQRAGSVALTFTPPVWCAGSDLWIYL